MNADVRTKIEMATRAREFCRAHPSDDAGYVKLVANLEELWNRAELVAAKQRAGLIAERSAAARRMELRERMHTVLLRHLVRLAEVVAKTRPDLKGKFKLPSTNVTNKTFIVAAKAMLAEAVVNKEVFLNEGLSPSMFDDLSAAILEFEGTIESGAAGNEMHVGASADLTAVAGELVKAVELISTFNLHRYRDDPELTAAWEAARTVIGPRVRRKEQAGEAPPEVTPNPQTA